MARDVVAVAAGAALGGVLRHGLSVAVQSATGPGFPTGTLVVNVVGGLVLGLIVGLTDGQSSPVGPATRLMLTVGLCGGFTTYSTFALDTVQLALDRAWLRAGLYLLLSNALTIGALALGRLLTSR